jgi:NAD(P)-dependent dehydrogenase (short-subunit alcohol dehydrogenase family)
VVVTARTAQPGKFPGTIHETAEAVRGLGGEALPVPCNVADEASVQAMVDTVLSQWGEIHILVNNAGVGSYLPFMETTVKVWDLIMAVNLRGAFLCSRAVLPHMIDRRRGSIVNISSTAANSVFSMTIPREGERTLVGIAYGVSKASLERLTTGLAAEVGRHNIAVNALKPGRPVLTEALKTHLPQSDWETWASTEKMVRAAVFLSAQDASGVTGAVTTDEELLVRRGL